MANSVPLISELYRLCYAILDIWNTTSMHVCDRYVCIYKKRYIRITGVYIYACALYMHMHRCVGMSTHTHTHTHCLPLPCWYLYTQIRQVRAVYPGGLKTTSYGSGKTCPKAEGDNDPPGTIRLPWKFDPSTLKPETLPTRIGPACADHGPNPQNGTKTQTTALIPRRLKDNFLRQREDLSEGRGC